MNRAFFLCIAAALAAVPLAYAHDPAGTPKNYCEPTGEWNVHEYAPLASGTFNFAPMDGNLAYDCDGSGLGLAVGSIINTNPPKPCPMGAWDITVPLPLPSPVDGVCIATPTGDYDGHTEFGQGGAYILAESGAGVPSSDPNVGAGTLYCFGQEGHHATFGPVTVYDVALASGAAFSVYSDTTDLTGTGEGCGDGISDSGSDCVGSCTLTFPSGLDGSYQVYVTGTQGHIIW